MPIENQVSKDYLQERVSFVLDHAKQSGASQTEVSISNVIGLSVNARLGEVETLEHQTDQGMSITLYDQQSKGSASTTDLTDASLQQMVQSALSLARHTASDDYAGLADASLMADPDQLPDLDLYHPWSINTEQAIELAIECEAAALQADARITNSEGASVSSYASMSVYGNSHGFIGGYQTTRHNMSCVCIASDQKGMQRDYYYDVARHAEALLPAVDIGQQAADRTLKRLDARKLKTQQAPVLFVPEMARSLFGSFMGAIRGSSQYRRSSYLLGSLETPVFPAWFNLHENPLIPRALASAPFDGEGTATFARDIIKDGVLQHYLLTSYSARRLGLPFTGNAGGIRNGFIEADAQRIKPFAELLKQMQTGLVVTEMMGQAANPVTGDFSRGAAGFWVEQGQIQYPVEEITVAGNLRDLFQRIQYLGSDIDHRSGLKTGSVLVDQLTIAGE